MVECLRKPVTFHRRVVECLRKPVTFHRRVVEFRGKPVEFHRRRVVFRSEAAGILPGVGFGQDARGPAEATPNADAAKPRVGRASRLPFPASCRELKTTPPKAHSARNTRRSRPAAESAAVPGFITSVPQDAAHGRRDARPTHCFRLRRAGGMECGANSIPPHPATA